MIYPDAGRPTPPEGYKADMFGLPIGLRPNNARDVAIRLDEIHNTYLHTLEQISEEELRSKILDDQDMSSRLAQPDISLTLAGLQPRTRVTITEPTPVNFIRLRCIDNTYSQLLSYLDAYSFPFIILHGGSRDRYGDSHMVDIVNIKALQRTVQLVRPEVLPGVLSFQSNILNPKTGELNKSFDFNCLDRARTPYIKWEDETPTTISQGLIPMLYDEESLPYEVRIQLYNSDASWQVYIAEVMEGLHRGLPDKVIRAAAGFKVLEHAQQPTSMYYDDIRAGERIILRAGDETDQYVIDQLEERERLLNSIYETYKYKMIRGNVNS